MLNIDTLLRTFESDLRFRRNQRIRGVRSSVLELNSCMSKSFDIGIESLGGGATTGREGRHGHLGSFAATAADEVLNSDNSAFESDASSALAAIPSDNKKSFYIETFGCQMNAQ